ncbi:MAG: hypothetical protein J6D52_12410, partial [Clostridia bacterium]|nr:hypothetical protein [Clostridia bacterium]
MCKCNFLKTISSFMLVTIMIINIFVPCISVFAESTDSASTTMNFPSPVFKGAPEYSYEICTPDVDIDISAFEQFAPELTSGV